MMNIITAFVVLCCLLLILGAGCFYSSDFRALRSELNNELAPLHLNPVWSFALGAASLNFVRFIVSKTDEDDEALEYLSNISKIQVGIYEINTNTKILPAGSLRGVEQKLQKNGWEILVRAREKNELALIFYKLKNEQLCALTLVALEGDELVLMELEGDLGIIIQKAIKEKGFKVDKVVTNNS